MLTHWRAALISRFTTITLPKRIRCGLLAIGLVAIIAAQPRDSARLDIRPAPVPDIQIIDSSQPEFDEYIAMAIPDAADRAVISTVLPYALVLKNSGHRSISWVTVDYSFSAPDGRPAGSTVTRDCRAFSNDQRSDIVAVITPDGWITQAIAGHRVSSLPSSQGFSERLDRIGALSRSRLITASLDSIAYSDGEFRGPDLAGRFTEMNLGAAKDLELTDEIRSLSGQPDEAISALLTRFINEKSAPNGGVTQAKIISMRRSRAQILRMTLESQGRSVFEIAVERLASDARGRTVWRGRTPDPSAPGTRGDGNSIEAGERGEK